MQHVYWILKDQLAGRCGPEKISWDPAQLYDAGIRVVVTVASEERVEDLTTYGLLHRRLALPPLPFLLRFRQRQWVRQIHPLLEFIAQQIQEERPVLVHCHDGDDRTGIVLSGYLALYKEMTPVTAVARVREVNSHAMKMPGYARAVRWFARDAQ